MREYKGPGLGHDCAMYLVLKGVGPLTGTVLITKLDLYTWLLIIPICFRCHFSRRLARSREKWRHCVTIDIAPFQVDPVYLSEFKAWRLSQPTSVDITCTFMNHIIKEEVNPCLNFHNSQVIISGTYKICSATRSQMYMFKFRNSQVYAQLPELTGINFQNLQNMLRYQITEVYVKVPELTGICSTEPVNQWGNIVNLTLKNKFQESEIYIEIHIFSFKKMLKMSPGKWCPLCIYLNVLMEMAFIIKDSVYCTKQDARCLYMQTGSTWRLDCSTLILYYFIHSAQICCTFTGT